MKKDIKAEARKIVSYWKTPPEGRYMPFKEIGALSMGGMGVRFIVNIVSTMILSTGNVLIGNTIGIPPMPIYYIYVISVLAGFPLTALRARIIDYSHNKKGKYRPYILSMSIPTAVLATGFVYMPYDRMSLVLKCSVVLLFNIGFQFFYMFLNDAYDNIINVLSPNTYERSDVFSIKCITDSFAPTLTNILLPIVAQLVTGEQTIYDMKVYRAFYPPLLFIGSVMSVLVYVGTKEKIVRPREHIVAMSFTDMFIAVAKNKYFWIISLASCLGFLESSFANILGWMYNYQKVCSAGSYALITTIYGNSALWAMIFAPFLVRKIGKKKLLVYSNLLNILFIAIMYPVVKDAPTVYMIWMFLFCLFVNGVVSQVTVTITPGINGDIRDYQQYITGERVDGVFSVAGLIGSIWTLGTSSVLPAIYDKAGLNSTVAKSLGFDGSNVYDVLYNEAYFRSVCAVLIVASVVGATLNVIPYFFYDLTENRQTAIVRILQIRAAGTDCINGTGSEEETAKAVELIKSAYANAARELLKTDRKSIASENGDSSVRREKRRRIKENNETLISRMVVEELEYYKDGLGKYELERARAIVRGGTEKLGELRTVSVEEAQRVRKEDRKKGRLLMEFAKAEAYSRKAVSGKYSEGLRVVEDDEFEALFNERDRLDSEIRKAAGERDRNTVRTLSASRKETDKKIKQLTKQSGETNRVLKPYTQAKKTVERYEGYTLLKTL